MKKFIDIVLFIYHAKKLESTYNKLIRANDYDNEKYYEKINYYSDSVVDKLDKFSQIIKNNEDLQKLSESMLSISLVSKFIKEFSSKNHIAALLIAKNLSNSKYETIAAGGVIQALDVINELKAAGKIDSIGLKEDEIYFKALVNQVNRKMHSTDQDVLKIKYNGGNMALAYNAWLDGNLEQSSQIFKEHMKIYGMKKIFESESIDSQPWYYKSLNPKYIEFLNYCVSVADEPKRKALIG